MNEYGMDLKIGISGKRYIDAGERADVKSELEKRINAILRLGHDKKFTGYTSLSSGADLLFAEVVADKFRMPFHVILPFAQEEYEKDFDEGSLETFRHLLKRAEKIHVQPGVPANLQQRNNAYFEQGAWMAEHCHEMIFVWDELKPGGHGGTAEIMAYYGVVKKRFNLPYIKVKPKQEDPLYKKIMREYDQTNERAIEKRNYFKSVWKAVIFLSWLAACLFSYNVWRQLDGWDEISLIAFELLLIILVFIFFGIARKKDFHGAYVKNRVKAESIRLLRCFYHAGLEIKQRPAFKENEGVISKFIQQINDANKKSAYISPWYTYYTIRSLIEEQIDYHAGRLKRIGTKPDWLEIAGVTVGVLFLLNLVIHLTQAITGYYNKELIPHYDASLAVALSIFFPATYAAIEGILHFQEWKILKKCSEQSGTDLRQCLLELPLPSDSTWDDAAMNKQSEILVNVCRIMLTDNNNWQLVLLDRNISVPI